MKTTTNKPHIWTTTFLAASFLLISGNASAFHPGGDPTASWYENPTIKKGQKIQVFKSYGHKQEKVQRDATLHWYDSGAPMKTKGSEMSASNSAFMEPFDHTSEPTDSWYDNGVPAHEK